MPGPWKGMLVRSNFRIPSQFIYICRSTLKNEVYNYNTCYSYSMICKFSGQVFWKLARMLFVSQKNKQHVLKKKSTMNVLSALWLNWYLVHLLIISTCNILFETATFWANWLLEPMNQSKVGLGYIKFCTYNTCHSNFLLLFWTMTRNEYFRRGF